MMPAPESQRKIASAVVIVGSRQFFWIFNFGYALSPFRTIFHDFDVHETSRAKSSVLLGDHLN